MIKVFQSIYEQDYNYIDDIRTWENDLKLQKPGQNILYH